MRVTFEEVSATATRRWKDPGTGKSKQETKRFFQTVNPFNKDPDGSLKTRSQIQAEVNAEAAAWLKEE